MKKYKIDELFTLIRNGANIKQDPNADGIPITRIETTSNDKFNRNKVGFANIYNPKPYENFILHDQDLLMSHINSEKYLGRSVLYNKKENEYIIHGMNLLLLRANADIIIPRYINLYFKSDTFKSKIAKITKKSVNQASFNVNSLKNIEVNIPELNEQAIIANKFDKLEALIEQNRLLLSKYDQLVKSQFIEMFGDVYSLQNETKHTIGDYVSDRTIKVSKLENQQKIKYIDISSINNQTNEITSYTEYEVNNRPSRAQQVVEKGDILISTVRPNLNNVAMVTDSFDNLVASTGFCVIKKNENVNEYFIFALVKNIEFANYLTKLTTGANYPAVNNKSILDFKLDIPPIELQNQFADFVKHIDKLKFRETITKLKNLCYNIFNIIQSKNLSEVKK